MSLWETSDELNKEYDDLTSPERFTNFGLLTLYVGTIIYILVKSNKSKMRKEARWLKDRNRMILLLILCSLLSRVLYFVDAFYWYVCPIDPDHPGQRKHLLPITVYMNLNTLTVFCVFQFCLLTCILW
jgi:hypothetical protein